MWNKDVDVLDFYEFPGSYLRVEEAFRHFSTVWDGCVFFQTQRRGKVLRMT